jgi:hypothetical protein
MTNQYFDWLARRIVYVYAKDHLDVTDRVDFNFEHDVYVVWSCKTLQNNKAMVSTNLPDGMYYEVTHNGDTGEIYLDAYKKFENVGKTVSEWEDIVE